MRTRPKASAVCAAALFLCALLPAYGRGRAERPLTGVVGNLLQRPMPAADFTLIDQHGASFHMADTRGKVVLMGFIYTHCTDLCPFIAIKMKDALDLLGPDASKVVLVAVTTDPKRDTPSVTAAYSKELGLLDAWHFVGGDPEAVQAVWSRYGIGVSVDQGTGAVATSTKDESGSSGSAEEAPIQGLSKSDLGLAGHLIDKFGGGYDVGHSAPFWFVDKKGAIRIGMDASATPTELANNVRALLKL